MNTDEWTIVESYTLPSKGKVYKDPVNPNIRIRSMTTQEEMKRLTHSDTPYKVLCDVIDACLVDDPGISSYDMCLGDYQFLLHKMRIVTYGSSFNAVNTCPYCATTTKKTIDLNDLDVMEYSEDLEKYFTVTLPRSKKTVHLKMQTPRSIDEITLRTREIRKKSSGGADDPTVLLTTVAVIDTVDGVVLDPIKLENFVRSLPMADTNYILQCSKKINEGIGLNTQLTVVCDGCGVDYDTSFRTTPEFFGPSID